MNRKISKKYKNFRVQFMIKYYIIHFLLLLLKKMTKIKQIPEPYHNRTLKKDQNFLKKIIQMSLREKHLLIKTNKSINLNK